MKKALFLALFTGLSFDVFAQTAGEVSLNTNSATVSNNTFSLPSLNDFGMSLSMETLTVRDRSNDINGNQTTFTLEPGLRLNRKMNVSIGALYTTRQMNSQANQRDSDKERNNSDHLDAIYAKFLYKPTRFRDNGIADIRLQARIYRDQNDIFMRRFGSDGNYQLRAYFGRPLVGKFSINKYTSYIRYKEYFTNTDASDFTRLSETRLRISPTYTPIDGLDLSVSFTYNRYSLRGNSSPDGRNYSEQVEIGPSARYQMGRYAILFWSDLDLLETNKFGSLAENEKADAEVTYALNFSAFL